MADIFFSYARADTARVRPIIESLEAEGLSVWWDPKILPGADDYDKEIERELTAARCVVVAWSAASRQSRWVKSEAYEADEQKKLVPILLEAVKPPIGLSLVQNEDLANWRGDRTDANWQRLLLQIGAYAGRSQVKAPAGVATTSGSRLQQRSAIVVGLALLTAMAVAGLQTDVHFGRHLCTFAVVGAFFYFLFRQADFDLSPNLKAVAARWLLPVEGKVKVDGTEAFLHAFEAVFDRRHFSWRCFWRSAVASIALNCVFVLTFNLSSLQSQLHDPTGVVVTVAVVVLLFFTATLNIISDYLSLGITRAVLKLGRAKRFSIVTLSLLDFVATGCIYLAIAAGFLVVLVVGAGGEFQFSPLKWLAPLAHEQDGGSFSVDFWHLLAYPGLLTTYMTSIWLWLAAITPPFARLLLWSRKHGATTLGHMFDTQARPFTALGFVAFVLLVLAGAVTSVAATL